MVTGLPMTSSAVYPKMRSAPWFQLWMMPLRSLLMMASSEEATMATKCRWSSGALQLSQSGLVNQKLLALLFRGASLLQLLTSNPPGPP